MAADAPLRRLARLVAGARRLVVLTGAGISTESGIPDYRGGEEHWARYGADCFAYDAFLGSAEARRRRRQEGADSGLGRPAPTAAMSCPTAASRSWRHLTRRASR